MDNSTRKEKVTKSQAKRARKMATQNPALQVNTATLNAADERVKEQIKSSQFQDYNAPTASAHGKEINPFVGAGHDEMERLAGPNAHNMGFGYEQKKDSDFRYTIKQPEYQSNISKVTLKVPSGAQITNPSGIATKVIDDKPATNKEETKLSPWEQMLKERRKTLKQEKTDAAKMQKYYALADALKSLGKMGGTALGSVIGGGKAIDNATQVGEYKASRGYLDAFEKAKNANEALRKLDDTEFQLKYADEQKKEERKHQKQLIAEEREFKLKVDQLDKQWQKDMIDYKAKIEQAATENNLALKAKYEAEAAALTQQYWKERAKITHGYTMEEKRVGNETIQNQYKLYNTVPIGFKNGTGITVPKPYYEDMLQFFIDEENGIDKDNVATYIRNNPDKVNAYLQMFGLSSGTMTPTAAQTGAGVQYQFPYHMSQIPADQMSIAPTAITVPASTTEQESNNTEVDYSQFKQQK